MFDKFKIEDYMESDFASISPSENVVSAITLMLKFNLTGIPVVDDSKKLIGFLSEKDCLQCSVETAYNNSVGGTVKDYMSTTPKSLNPKTTIIDAALEFTHVPYHCFPIIDSKGDLVGVLKRSNVLVGLIDMNKENILKFR
jgi:CBS-domain-containing membrane protein